MLRRFAVTIAAASVGLFVLGSAVSIHAQSPGAIRPLCYRVFGYEEGRNVTARHVPIELSYVAGLGVYVGFERVADDGTGAYGLPYQYTAWLPLFVDGEPNPDFDRLYALIMRGFDSGRISQVCLDGEPSAHAALNLKGLSLRHLPDPALEVQKVAICDVRAPESCSSVLRNGLMVHEGAAR